MTVYVTVEEMLCLRNVLFSWRILARAYSRFQMNPWIDKDEKGVSWKDTHIKAREQNHGQNHGQN